MTIEVEIKGLDPLQRKFNMFPRMLQKEIDSATKRASFVAERAAQYPPPPPQSSYVRTGTLARGFSWKVHTLGREVTGSVINPVSYAKWVRGTKTQAWMHVGRWKTMQQIVDESRGRLTTLFEKAMQNLAKFLGD